MYINFGKYEISSRLIKKLLALGLVMIIMEIIGQGDSGNMIAGMSALILLGDGVTPHKAAPGRIVGQSFGAILSLVYFFIYDSTGKLFVTKLFLVLFFVLIITIVLLRFNLNSGVFGGITTFLIIVFMIPDGSALSYCLVRIFDSFIGIIVAILVNTFWIEKEIVKVEMKVEEVIENLEKRK
ncbi:membrane protein [Lactococcus garvieae TRF1]|uniref:Membrane protein n=1 Tax=Lactococcus garvieae TRF1 TaxID=1380772 RepID=V8AMW5_9LACT|nr:membrane protein [Lactococcus garvieae TRF1]